MQLNSAYLVFPLHLWSSNFLMFVEQMENF